MRAIVVANGPSLEYPRLFKHRENDRIIAADGGTLTALRWGWIPDDVVGDLDSLPEDIEQRLRRIGCRFMVYPQRKDSTDLELALRYAIEEGAKEIVVLGARGGRLDQELSNVLLLGREDWGGVELRMMDGREEALIVRDEAVIRGNIGDVVSLIALTPRVTGLHISGVDWPLKDATLPMGSTLGVSNVLTEPKAKVALTSGKLLAVHIMNHRGVPKGLSAE